MAEDDPFTTRYLDHGFGRTGDGSGCLCVLEPDRYDWLPLCSAVAGLTYRHTIGVWSGPGPRTAASGWHYTIK